MKREGRQHGMVRTYPILPNPWNLRPKTRTLNGLDSPPTAGVFTKVSTKPTNHSKFTGKCGRPMCRQCHIHPASKSKDKAKGAQKLRFSSAWKVVDAESDLKFSGFSVSSALNFLTNKDYYGSNYIDDNDIEVETEEANECDTSNYGINREDNEDQLSFCEVGFVCQVEDGDEDWCLVEEM